MLQGSSSAPPTYNVNSDIALTVYNNQATGATIQHPITGSTHADASIQFVDDKTGLLNNADDPSGLQIEELFQTANKNSTLWSNLLWTSGGKLNATKCFFYFIYPRIDYPTRKHKYYTTNSHPGKICIPHPSSGGDQELPRFEPHQAKRTLGVHLAPNGSSTEQIKITLQKIRTYKGKITNCNLTTNLYWLAVKTILEPGVIYPLMATIYNH